jgi:hypothetical protein
MENKEIIKLIDEKLKKIYKGCKRYDGKRTNLGLWTDENNKLHYQYCGDLKTYFKFNKTNKIMNNRGKPTKRGQRGFIYRDVILCAKCSNQAKPLEELKQNLINNEGVKDDRGF